MKQVDYTLIVACIRTGAPAVANELINALNAEIQLANTTRPELNEQDIKGENN